MKVVLILIVLIICPFISWRYDKIASILKKENPSVFEEYGDATNFKFAWQFIFMGLYKSENISTELKKYIRNTNIISLTVIGIVIFSIPLI